MPVLWALANPKMDEREVLAAMLDREPHLATDRPDLLVIADKGFASREFEADLAFRGAELLRPSFKREKNRKGENLLKSVRQLIESVNDTLKGQLDLEHHGGRTFEGVAVRVAQRILAMAAAIWHNHKTRQPVTRSLPAFSGENLGSTDGAGERVGRIGCVARHDTEIRRNKHWRRSAASMGA
ncbi:transposase [Streptomyces scabiei]|uniref:transposase n=1 Tax=Streptomyces scabiei TaxID=1930 RepID=UPI002990149F|nr:transposase [Streptomyces scabiei]MDW8803620.1 transposase [Streptomyces scabiei]